VSPQLLLVLMVALVTASLTGLCTRKPFYYLPIYWVLSVSGLLIGQVIGRAANLSLLVVGQVQLGAGLICTLMIMVGLYLLSLWYNPGRR
jgi:hypothetical protein